MQKKILHKNEKKESQNKRLSPPLRSFLTPSLPNFNAWHAPRNLDPGTHTPSLNPSDFPSLHEAHGKDQSTPKTNHSSQDGQMADPTQQQMETEDSTELVTTEKANSLVETSQSQQRKKTRPQMTAARTKHPHGTPNLSTTQEKKQHQKTKTPKSNRPSNKPRPGLTNPHKLNTANKTAPTPTPPSPDQTTKKNTIKTSFSRYESLQRIKKRAQRESGCLNYHHNTQHDDQP